MVQPDSHEVRDTVAEPDRRAVDTGGTCGDPARVLSAYGAADPERGACADTDLDVDNHHDIDLDVDGRPQRGTV